MKFDLDLFVIHFYMELVVFLPCFMALELPLLLFFVKCSEHVLSENFTLVSPPSFGTFFLPCLC